jgi:hypothetical protein
MKREKATAGDSGEQRSAERQMLAELEARLGIAFGGSKYPTPDSARLEIDGVSETPLELCEAYAHQGSPKSGQKSKILADAFKLIYAERLAGKKARKIILLADEQAAAPFRGKKWVAEAFRTLGIEVEVVDLGPELRERVRKAQARQFR